MQQQRGAQNDLNYVFTKQYTSLNLPFTRSQIAMGENAKALALIHVWMKRNRSQI